MHIKFNSWINVLCMHASISYSTTTKKNRWWWYRHAHIKPCSLLIQKRGTTLFICTSIVACRRFKFATLQSTLSLFSRCLFYPLSHTRAVALYILTPHSLKILRKILYKMNNWFSIVRKWWEKRMKKAAQRSLNGIDTGLKSNGHFQWNCQHRPAFHKRNLYAWFLHDDELLTDVCTQTHTYNGGILNLKERT